MKSRVGGKDAMRAAIYTGLLWMIKGWGMNWLTRHSHLKKVQLVVEPDYLSTDFASQIDCILKIRIVHIITNNNLFKQYGKSGGGWMESQQNFGNSRPIEG
jgi:hypothetical protein